MKFPRCSLREACSLPCVKGTRQRVKSPQQSVCRVLHTANSTRHGKQHTANKHRQRAHLPCAIYRALGKEVFRKLILKIGNKKNLIHGGPHLPFHQSRKSQLFLCTLRPVGFEPATSPSHLTFSTTAPHTQFCLYFNFFPHILY